MDDWVLVRSRMHETEKLENASFVQKELKIIIRSREFLEMNVKLEYIGRSGAAPSPPSFAF